MENRTFSIYLSHHFGDRKWVRDWQLSTSPHLPHLRFVNPFYDLPGRNGVEAFDQGQLAYSDLLEASIVDRDLAAIRNCDMLLSFFFGGPSIGTPMELCYASSVFRHPTISCILPDILRSHPWITYHSNRIFYGIRPLEIFLADENQLMALFQGVDFLQHQTEEL